MLGHGGHPGWHPAKLNTIFKGDHPRTISPKFGYNWLNSFREVDKNVNPHRLNVKLSRAMAAMFDGAWKLEAQRTEPVSLTWYNDKLSL